MTTNGIVTKISNKSFDDTYETLKNILENNPNLSIIAALDHSANATKVDLNLNPTRILFFGNPKLGTVVMQDNQSVGIDLPQKMLVMEQEGQVKVLYNDPNYLKERHSLGDAANTVLEKMSAALNMISNTATGA